MKKVILFGNGQMAELAHVYLAQDESMDIVAFTVDREFNQEKTFRGLPVVDFETVEDEYSPDEYHMFVPIGAKQLNQLRASKYSAAKEKGYRFVSYVSPHAQVSPETYIGENCFILENNVIQPFVTIKDNVFLWSGNHIGHHTTINEHCFIASHTVISGCVTIGAYSYFGVNATVRDAITIGEKCIIGAGALVLKSTQDKQVFPGHASAAHRVPSDKVKVA